MNHVVCESPLIKAVEKKKKQVLGRKRNDETDPTVAFDTEFIEGREGASSKGRDREREDGLNRPMAAYLVFPDNIICKTFSF